MNPVSKYFNGEKIQCAIGIVFGVLSISIALYLLFKSNKPFHPDSYRQGIAYPFIIIPVLLMIICVGVVVRSAKDIVRVDNIIQNDRSKIKTEELPRMETVLKNFRIIIWVEVCFIIAGVLLFLLMPSGSAWKGVGTGLIIQAVALLIFDIVADSRGKVYHEFLQTVSL